MKSLFSIRLIVFALLATSLSGCLMTREEIAEEENRKAVQQQVSTLQKTHADQQNQYTEMNEEIRSLNGRIETLENQLGHASKEREKIQMNGDQQLAEANKKIAALQEEVQKLENQVTYLSQEIVKIETAKPAATVAAVPAKLDKKADYYQEAEEQFNRKEFKQAILNYQKYREAHPNAKRVGLATYKIGLAFQELGMKEEAKTFFDEVQSKYPGTELAKQAKDRQSKTK